MFAYRVLPNSVVHDNLQIHGKRLRNDAAGGGWVLYSIVEMS